eukprot:767527-Hanusia_phi.AAC.2
MKRRYRAVETAQVRTQKYPGRLNVRSVSPAMAAPADITKTALRWSGGGLVPYSLYSPYMTITVVKRRNALPILESVVTGQSQART